VLHLESTHRPVQPLAVRESNRRERERERERLAQRQFPPASSQSLTRPIHLSVYGRARPPWLLSPIVSSASDGPTFARCWWRVKLGLPTLDPWKTSARRHGMSRTRQGGQNKDTKHMLRLQRISSACMRKGRHTHRRHVDFDRFGSSGRSTRRWHRELPSLTLSNSNPRLCMGSCSRLLASFISV